MNRNSGSLLILLVGLAGLVATAFLLAGPTPQLALLVPLALPIMALLGRWPVLGYYLIIALVPLDAWRVLSEEYRFLTISKFVGAWIALIVAIHVAIDPPQGRRLVSGIWVPLLLFFLVSVLATMFGLENQTWFSIDHLRQLATAYVFVALTLYFVNERRFLQVLPVVMITTTTFASALAVFGHTFGIASMVMAADTTDPMGRIVGSATDPNFFAAMVLCALPLLAHCMVTTTRHRVRALYVILFAINAYAIVLTYSRGVMLVFGLTMLLLCIEHIRHLRVRHIGFIVIALGILGAAAVVKLPGTAIWERMLTIVQPRSDASMQARTSYLIVARDVAMKNPILGTGPGTFPFHYAKSLYPAMFAREHSFEGYARAAHNTYIEVLVGTGFTGLFVFLALVLTCFWYFFHAQRVLHTIDPQAASLLRALAICFVAVLASFLFLSDLYHKYIWLFVGLAGDAGRIAARRHGRE